MNTAHVVKSTEAFKQWEYRAGKGNGEERKRRGDESPIIDEDDDEDDEDEDEEERGSPVIEDATCPFKKSYEDEEDDEVSDTAC